MLAAGLGAALALVWAGGAVSGNAGVAGEVAVKRIAGQVADTVVAEWERMLRDPARPVEPSGEIFRWRNGQAPLEPLALRERWAGPPAGLSVLDTLLAESERLELAEEDPRAALELVLEGLAKEPAAEHLAEGFLRAIQLADRLSEIDLAREHWELMQRQLTRLDAREGIPYLVLGWLALPEELRAGTPAREVLPVELERLFVEEDRLLIGSARAPRVTFELSPTLAVICDRMGVELPSLERRKHGALARKAKGELPAIDDDDAWHPLWIEGSAPQLFLARSRRGEIEGFFTDMGSLERALEARASVPGGFSFDLTTADTTYSGDSPEYVHVHLPGSELALCLSCTDPERIARQESARLAWLRAALFVLAAFCAAGAFFTARALRRERKLAELKSAFIAGVSHDLRTPLASILLLAENLETGRASEENRARYHRTLRREAERLRRLIDDVLDFSRLERGEGANLHVEDVDLPRFLEALARECRERVEEAERPFVLEPGAVPRGAALDAVALRRAALNLVDNALKHGEGEVKLTWEAGDGRLRLCVSDRGAGISLTDREKVFRPFERLPAGGAGNGAPGGIGLGLAIVRSIARAHGGDSRVRPGENGAGASFEIELPLGVEA